MLALALTSGAERRRPPEITGCSRDRLTSFTGRIVALKRDARGIGVTIAADWDSTERLRIPSTLDGAVKLKQGERVTLWVCGESRVVRIDRLPPKE